MKKLLKFVGISFGGIIALLFVIGVIVGDPNKKAGAKAEPSTTDSTTETADSAPAPTIPLPPTEAKLIDIVEQKRAAFEGAANDFAKGSTRAQRGRAICAALPNGVANQWIGTVDTLSSTSDGKGVLAVRIGPHVTISTNNNTMSDSLEGGTSTLIDPSSPLSEQIGGLKEGDQVKFTARFKRSSGNDCLEELSMTQAGSMTDPNYIAVFTSVEKTN